MMTLTEEEWFKGSASQSNSLTLLFLAGSLSFIPVAHANHDYPLAQDSYRIQHAQKESSSPQFVSITESQHVSDDEILSALLQVHNSIAVEQKSLDPEAENLLRDNLSDLYL